MRDTNGLLSHKRGGWHYRASPTQKNTTTTMWSVIPVKHQIFDKVMIIIPYNAWQLDTEVISNPGSELSFLFDVCNYILDKLEIFSEITKFNALRAFLRILFNFFWKSSILIWIKGEIFWLLWWTTDDYTRKLAFTAVTLEIVAVSYFGIN